MTIKVGDKQRHVSLPDNCTQITEGEAQLGDLFYDVINHRWRAVEKDFDVGMPASSFEVLARPNYEIVKQRLLSK